MPERRLLALGAVLAGALLAAPLAALPDAAEAPVKAARAALARSDGIAAEAELNRALAAGAGRGDVAAAMGEALIEQGQLKRAREWLGPVQFARGTEAYGWRMLGLLERQDGNLAAAGRAYEKALALTPKDPQLWVDIGRMRYTGGEQIQAVQAANRALELGPGHPRALEFRAQLLRDGGDPAGALALFERALERAPDDLDLLGGQAATLGELGRAGEMLAVTRRMVELSPRDPYAYYLQAVLAARAGKTDLARAVLNRAGDRPDEVPAAMLLEGLLELEAGNAHVAADRLEQLAQLQSANPRVQALLARALYESGEYDRLFDRFTPLAARADAPAYLLEILGRAYEERGDRAAAAPLLDRAAAAAARPLQPITERDAPGVLASGWRDNPGSPGTAVPYVRSLLSTGQTAQAGQVALRFQALHPGSYEALVLGGDTELAAGRTGSALQRYQLASLVRFPDLLLLRICLAYERSGQGGMVRPLVARYLASVPQSPMAARLAAGQSAFAGDWARTRMLLESLRKRGGSRDVRLLADLSFAQLRDGDGEAAAESATRAWQLQPANPVAAQARAMALAALGRDKAQARQLLEQARRSGGDNPLLAETRKKLGVH